ncbi:MAG: GNAT family N-acetyltransferase [Solirubrobacterales bacterium]|nr:GNAT family N-acetyltransferase [Solirubrobacterales bacterium]
MGDAVSNHIGFYAQTLRAREPVECQKVRVGDLRFRLAVPSDAEAVAALHADSWRRHYRGAYSDDFLDGDVQTERAAVWSERLSERNGATRTVVAEDDDGLVGFAHTVFEADPRWGALIDNLHLVYSEKRRGIGSRLITLAARPVLARGTGLYLWVLEQNSDARAFYEARGGRCVERALVPAPGGIAGRLNGTPFGLRYAWSDPAVLL